MKIIKESFQFNSLDDDEKDQLYSEFKASYEKETGAAWDESKFISRSRAWTFYGTVKGGVAVRKQRSGLIKLVAVFGNPLTVARAFKEMQTEENGVPIWGAMTKNLADMMERFTKGEFKRPPGIFVKMLVPYIKNVFGDDIKSVGMDGGITMDVAGIGTFKKFFIANKAYYRWIMENGVNELNIPDPVKNMIIPLLVKMI